MKSLFTSNIAFCLLLIEFHIVLTSKLKLFNRVNLITGNSESDMDIKRTFEDIVTRKGYPLEVHEVTTEDGYILTLYRIPNGKTSFTNVQTKFNDDTKRMFNNTKLIRTNSTCRVKSGKSVVLLQHGLLDSSDSFIANYEDHSIAFILANKGYDVWLGNNRGNKHSRKHITYNPDKDKKFWDFSFHEMGTKDVPAMINYITNCTSREKISFIGHSQGTTQLFAGMSVMPDYYKKKLNGFIAMGPVAKLDHLQASFLKMIAQIRIDKVLNFFGADEILPSPDSVHNLNELLCEKLPGVCNVLLEYIADSDTSDDDEKRLLVFVSHFPSGSSLKSFRHFGQIIRNKRFSMFDYKENNMKIYNQTNPPLYDLKNIEGVPIAMFVGREDKLSTVEDSHWIRNELLKKGLLHFDKVYDKVGHSSFWISKDCPFHKDILKCLSEFNI